MIWVANSRYRQRASKLVAEVRMAWSGHALSFHARLIFGALPRGAACESWIYADLAIGVPRACHRRDIAAESAGVDKSRPALVRAKIFLVHRRPRSFAQSNTYFTGALSVLELM